MRGRSADAAGFSLVEIVVAMFLLTVIALALLPALMGATKVSVVNRSLVEATAFANAQLAEIRAAFPDYLAPGVPVKTKCTDLAAKNNQVVLDQPAPNTRFSATIKVGACPSSGPGSVVVSVSVTESGSSTKIVEAPTKVFVGGP